MSQSAGPGSPVSFRCSACRSKYWNREYHAIKEGRSYPASYVERWGYTVKRTDKYRPYKAPYGSALGVRSNIVSLQYRCEHCGHVGWSNHKDLARAPRHGAL